MNNEELLTRVQDIFRDVFDDPSLVISRSSTADSVPGWDSLAHVNLLTAVQNEFKIKLALGERQKLKNVGDLLDLVEAKLAARK